MKNKDKQKGLLDVQDVIYLIGGKWRGAILASLCDKPKRFNELKRDVGKITSRSLIKELTILEMNKLIYNDNRLQKDVFVYTMTKHGNTLQPLIAHIIEWAKKHRKIIYEK